MLLMAVDTCLGACSAVLAKDGRVLAQISEPMTRGHQERLAPMVEDLIKGAGVAFADLTRIAATVGPGSFTGLRVGLSFGKAMALALDIPCVGIGSLPALAAGRHGLTIAIVDARRDQAYWQAFEDGAPVTGPAASHIDDVIAWLAGRPAEAAGPGAAMLGHLSNIEIVDLPAPDPEALATLAARADPAAPARPIYLRAPDAKLPGGKDPVF